jgi:streptogramin lyase
VRLAWQPPDGPPQTVPAWALYVAPVQSNGLLGRYFANGDWRGEPTLEQIDPRLNMYFHVPALPRPYTVEWSGKIAIPAAGHYDFGLQSIDDSTLAIDGQTVVGDHERNSIGVGGLTLDAGLHDILIRYGDRTDHTYITLTWRPPGADGAMHEIPSDLLFPPQGNYEQVNVSDLARFMQSDNEPKDVEATTQVDPAQVNVIASGLLQPHGVAVANGIVYVAETGNKRVKAYDAKSGKEVASPYVSINFQEPFDIAAQADGSIVVLDAGAGQLLRYDPATGEVSALPASPDYVNRSRGIGAGLKGQTWIANTPGQRIVAVDNRGAVLQAVALPSTSADVQEMQPTDVVEMGDNTLFVADAAANMLYHFSVAGYLLASQPIPVSNTLDSTHLVADQAGGFYMTEPEPGLVLRLDGTGSIEHVWNVRSAAAPDAKPVGVAVSSDGVIWVADSQGGRLIQVIPEAAK